MNSITENNHGIIWCYKDAEGIFCLNSIANVQLSGDISPKFIPMNEEERENAKDIFRFYPETEFILRSWDLQNDILEVSRVVYRVNRSDADFLNWISSLPTGKIIFSYL